jgi:GTPase
VGHLHDAAVIDRVAEAMSATLADDGEGMPGEFLAALRAEWDAGRASVAPLRVFGYSPAPGGTPRAC